MPARGTSEIEALLLLEAIYRRSENQQAVVQFEHLQDEVKLSDAKLKMAWDYLLDKKFISPFGAFSARITADGRDCIENAQKRPDQTPPDFHNVTYNQVFVGKAQNIKGLVLNNSSMSDNEMTPSSGRWIALASLFVAIFAGVGTWITVTPENIDHVLQIIGWRHKSTTLSRLSMPPNSAPTQSAKVSTLIQNLGSSEASDRYYALRQGVAGLGPETRISAGDALVLLKGIRAPELRYDALDQWLLPKLVTPLSPAEAVQLLSGFSSPERTRLLQRIQPCIDRPIKPDTINTLLMNVAIDARTTIASALDHQSSCPAEWLATH